MQDPQTTTSTLVESALVTGESIPCTYCRTGIPAEIFVYWSDAKRVLSAPCPGCQRQMTLSAAAWHRWSGLPDDISAIAADPVDPGELCACGHPLASHDRVGLRYCQASASSGLSRGCICSGAKIST